MYNHIRNLFVSSVASIQARLDTDKGVTSEELPGSHPGSFNAVLLRLLDWATSDPTPFLSWLTGPSPTASSAVTHSLIAHLKSQHHPVAYFSTNTTPTSIKSLIPTLAHQIARAIPEFQSHTASKHAHSSFQSQFDTLISNPILKLNLSPARRRASLPILIIINGLDQFNDEKSRSIILTTILKAAPRLRRHLKFLIVSQPKSDIQNIFQPTTIQDDISVINLSTYLSRHTKNVLPRKQLPYNPIHNTDRFFHTILSSTTTNKPTLLHLLSVILVCLQTDTSPLNPLKLLPTSLTHSDRFIESILNLEPKSLQIALSDLTGPLISFRRKMHIPTLDGHGGPLPLHDDSTIRILKFSHRSFKDFLMDQSRSKEFYIDLNAACLTVAKGILRYLADKGSRNEKRYWTLEAEYYDPRPAYHNCFLWCYERSTHGQTPTMASDNEEDLMDIITEYNPIDYLTTPSSRNNLNSESLKSITDVSYQNAVALFTFACKSLRRFEDVKTSPFGLNPTDIFNHFRTHLNHHLTSELHHFVPPNSNLMHALKASIHADHIDWDTFRSTSAPQLELQQQRRQLKPTDSEWWLAEHESTRCMPRPYFLMWMFDEGLGYAAEQGGGAVPVGGIMTLVLGNPNACMSLDGSSFQVA